MNMFRTLRADEIDCRIGMQKEKFLTLLLYKDARCDMNILDETVGEMNWRREHSRDNANCTVSIRDKETGEWVSKEDTGAESNTEPKKGLASDSFKRACVNWGIGRELYTAPEIKLWQGSYSTAQNGKTYDRFRVLSIDYDECRNIVELKIINVNSGKCVFALGRGVGSAANEKKQNMPQPPQEVLDAMSVKIAWTNGELKELGTLPNDILLKLINSQKSTVTIRHKQAAQTIMHYREQKGNKNA